MKLIEIRKKIDFLDNELIKIITKRMSLMPKIAQIKKEEGLSTFDADREIYLLADRMQVAKELGLDPKMIEKIFKILLNGSRKIQEEIIVR